MISKFINKWIWTNALYDPLNVFLTAAAAEIILEINTNIYVFTENTTYSFNIKHSYHSQFKKRA